MLQAHVRALRALPPQAQWTVRGHEGVAVPGIGGAERRVGRLGGLRTAVADMPRVRLLCGTHLWLLQASRARVCAMQAARTASGRAERLVRLRAAAPVGAALSRAPLNCSHVYTIVRICTQHRRSPCGCSDTDTQCKSVAHHTAHISHITCHSTRSMIDDCRIVVIQHICARVHATHYVLILHVDRRYA